MSTFTPSPEFDYYYKACRKGDREAKAVAGIRKAIVAIHIPVKAGDSRSCPSKRVPIKKGSHSRSLSIDVSLYGSLSRFTQGSTTRYPLAELSKRTP